MTQAQAIAAWPLGKVLEQCDFAALIGDMNCRFVFTNGAAQRFFGYGADALLEKSFADLTHPDDRAASKALVHGLMTEKLPGFIQEKRYLLRDGGVRWGRVRLSLLR